MPSVHGSPFYVVRSQRDRKATFQVYDKDGPVSGEFLEYDADRRAIFFNDARKWFGPESEKETVVDAHPYSRLFGDFDYRNRFSEDALNTLGDAMIWPYGTEDIPDSNIPAGYTYLGQLLFHDVTWLDFDECHHLARNLTSSQLDLLSIIGTDALLGFPGPFALGRTIPTHPLGELSEDLPRHGPGDDVGCPQIADARNDSFLPLAQTHLLFLKFYNKVALYAGYGTAGFDEGLAKTLYVQHVQSMVLGDYLKRLIDCAVYEDVIKNGRSFISPGFCDILNYEVSIEFAVAFGRFGHSMIRREYSKWNTAGKVGNIDNFTEFSYRNREFGRPLVAVESDWVTSWQYLFPFAEFNGAGLPINSARIGPHLAHTLGTLRERLRSPLIGKACHSDEVVTGVFNLAAATLQRQRSLGLVSAEEAIEIVNRDRCAPLGILSPADLSRDLAPSAQALFADGGVFNGCTPLWFYMLREAQLRGGGNKLGPFASRIVMETLHACMAKSEDSILRCEGWVPELKCRDGKTFTMADLIRFSGEIDPIGC